MKFFGSLRDDGIKEKLSSAIREIETHRTNLLSLKDKLEARCKDFLEIVKKESELKEDAKFYGTEYSELEKVVQIVNASELVLSQLILRLETLKDLGDAVYHLSSALKAMKKIDKSVSGLLPSIEGVLDEFNSTLNEIIIELQITLPSIYLNLKKEEGEEFIEEAIKYVEKKAMQKEILTSKDELIKTKRVALLATGESMDETEPEFIISSKSSKLDEAMLNYIYEHKDNLNLIEASTLLDVPLDEVKQSILRLLHEGKVSFGKKAE
ncbi:MAG: hypothetical protein H3Z54_03280 [archaeon]|nr:hypothetical protein [archaeon]